MGRGARARDDRAGPSPFLPPRRRSCRYLSTEGGCAFTKRHPFYREPPEFRRVHDRVRRARDAGRPGPEPPVSWGWSKGGREGTRARTGPHIRWRGRCPASPPKPVLLVDPSAPGGGGRLSGTRVRAAGRPVGRAEPLQSFVPEGEAQKCTRGSRQVKTFRNRGRDELFPCREGTYRCSPPAGPAVAALRSSQRKRMVPSRLRGPSLPAGPPRGRPVEKLAAALEAGLTGTGRPTRIGSRIGIRHRPDRRGNRPGSRPPSILRAGDFDKSWRDRRGRRVPFPHELRAGPGPRGKRVPEGADPHEGSSVPEFGPSCSLREGSKATPRTRPRIEAETDARRTLGNQRRVVGQHLKTRHLKQSVQREAASTPGGACTGPQQMIGPRTRGASLVGNRRFRDRA